MATSRDFQPADAYATIFQSMVPTTRGRGCLQCGEGRILRERAALTLGFALALSIASVDANAVVHDAADVSTYPVVGRGPIEMVVDLEFDDWCLANEVLFMGEDTWEELGGSWDDEADLSATLQIVWEPEGLYLKLIVTDDEFVAQGGNPWENDGIQMAIDASAGELDPGLLPTGSPALSVNRGFP